MIARKETTETKSPSDSCGHKDKQRLNNPAVRVVTVLILLALWVLGRAPLAAEDLLLKGFQNPPDSAKPHTWWHWMNGNVTREGITADLEAMKRVGVGGAQVFDVDCGIPAGPVEFMGSDWRKMILHATREADRLGLELCIHNCSGWSSSGGPWVKPEHAMQMVVYSEAHVVGPVQFSGLFPQPPAQLQFYRDIAVLAFRTPANETKAMPEVLGFMPLQVTASDPTFDSAKILDGKTSTFSVLPAPEPGNPRYVQIQFPKPISVRVLRLVFGPGCEGAAGDLQVSDDGKAFQTVQAFSIPKVPSRHFVAVQRFEPLSSRYFRILFTDPGPQAEPIAIAEVSLHQPPRIENLAGKAAYVRTDNIEPAKDANVPKSAVVNRAEIMDLTGRMDSSGRLACSIPEGEWTILRMGYTPTGKKNHPATPSGLGLECDKMSREAMDAFFAGMMQTVIDDVGILAGKVLNNALIDSYEVGSQNWTPRFREGFQERRGYDLLPYLPVLTGRIVDSLEISERFLWDFRRTIADLFADNYFGYFGELCHKHGMLFSLEPYGNGPFENLACGGRADIPMSEFWIGSFSGHTYSGNAKESASAAHTYGRKIVAAESFTATPDKGRWQNHPYSMKALGDSVFCSGVNRFVFHRYAHQPWLNLVPGMTMGQWGFHFDRTNTWWDQSSAWLQYISRCQFLLQQGLFVGDVCYFCGENAPNGLQEPGGLSPPLPQDYSYDGCSAEVILERMAVKDGRIVLPDGMRYSILVLPRSETMTPAVARKIRELVKEGATVVGPRPVRSPSLSGYPQCDEEVKGIGEEVWGSCDGKAVLENRFGKGLVVWGRPLEEVLAVQGLKPDFEYTSGRPNAKLLYIHRRIGNLDLYFVSNQSNRLEPVDCTFRVGGKVPELWHPETGKIEEAPMYREEEGRTTVTLLLEPVGSVFVVFRESSKNRERVASFHRNGKPLLTSERQPARKLHIVKAIYGVLEDPSQAVDVTGLVAGMVEDDTLSVEASNRLAGDPAYGIVKKMRVDCTLNGMAFSKIVTENETLFIPEYAADECPAAELKVTGESGLELIPWEPGLYEMETALGRRMKVQVPSVAEPMALAGPWEVRFPPERGAPETIVLDNLISWTDHEKPGVRYFSGTAEYVKEIKIPASMFGPGKALYLDLGRVKSLAEVKANGKPLGILWKPPFRIEMTDAVHPGTNRLEIRVTNLWSNRLIGDEQLPDDCEWQGIALKEWPQWLLEGKPRPSKERCTFTTWKHWTRDSSPLESGLLGPVNLRSVERIPVQ